MLEAAENPWSLTDAAHLLNRAGFGGDPSEIAAFHALGRTKAVESLLNEDEALEAFPLPAWAGETSAAQELKQRAAEQREFRLSIQSLTPEAAAEKRREFQKESQRVDRERTMEARDWWFRRMLVSKVPLREKMTLFWHDHFATSAQKVREPIYLVWQNETFRRHAFGSFRELTQAMLHDPAMVLYLDVQSSKKGKPNENFARELMELFTLGVGNYAEKDIREVARAMTGYELKRGEGKVFHNPRQWDDGVKTCFGQSGKFNGGQVIDMIFKQDQPAKFMTRKVWEFFVAENPPDTLVEKLAVNFRASDYRMDVLLREIFRSKEFYAPEVVRNQIKCPIQYLVALMKQLEITEIPRAVPLAAQQQLGQLLFAPPNVAGWDWGKGWINTNTLLARYNFAGTLTKGATETTNEKGKNLLVQMAAGRWPGPDYEKITPRPSRENPEKLVDDLISRFFQASVPAQARESFITYAQEKKGVIFTNKEVAELCLLILSTPYYQLT
ncbi:MAG: DUF1800 domain-containing protein [Luteolibacter sp.]